VLDLLKLVVFSVVRCWHLKTGPIITCRPGQPCSAVAAITGTYFVCLGCGKEYAYDLKTGRILDPEPGRLKMIAARIAELCTGKTPNHANPEREVS
jgi:hypothetical protein